MASQAFCDLLRHHRLAVGLTQEGLAERAALSVHGIQKLERGVTRPFRDTVERLVGALNLDGAEAAALRGAATPVHRTGWPSRTSDAQVLSNLPAPLTRLVGRERDLDELRRLLGERRML